MKPCLLFLLLFCFITSPAWANDELEALYDTVNKAHISVRDPRFCEFLEMVRAWIHFSIVSELGPGVVLDQVFPDLAHNFLRAREILLVHLRVFESDLHASESWPMLTNDPLNIINERFLTWLSPSVSLEWARQLLESEIWRAVFEADLMDCLQAIINNISRLQAEFLARDLQFLR